MSYDGIRPRLQLALGAHAELGRELPPRGPCRVFDALPKTAAPSGATLRLILHPPPPAGPEPAYTRERAEAFAGLAHPALVPPLAVGELDGQAWVLEAAAPSEGGGAVMAWAGMLPLRDGIGVMRELARVLAAIHRRGLAHGAIDAEYVWIDGEQVRISGTGLATTGTARDDLDQLARLVWLMFTGAAAGVPPGPLSRRRRGVPAELDQLLIAMLAADPADRPPRAETILGSLDALPAPGQRREALADTAGGVRPRRSWLALAVLLVIMTLLLVFFLSR